MKKGLIPSTLCPCWKESANVPIPTHYTRFCNKYKAPMISIIGALYLFELLNSYYCMLMPSCMPSMPLPLFFRLNSDTSNLPNL